MNESQTELWIDPILYTGRPEASSPRSPDEWAVYDFLDSLHISYQRLDHDATPTIAFCEKVEERLGTEICKNLFLCNRQKTDFYLLVMPGKKQFHTKELSKQIGSARLSFGDPSFMQEFLHTTPGSASILGFIFDTEHRVRLLIDRDILKSPLFACHPCVNTSSLRFDTKDVLEKVLPSFHIEPTYVTLGKDEETAE